MVISNIFNQQERTLPRDVKEAVNRCREATQLALQDRISRMEVEFPVGTKFGVEKVTKQRKQRRGGEGGDDNSKEKGGRTRRELEKSDRELARIFVEMFQPVGSDRIAVAFSDVTAADAAKNLWKDDPSAGSRVLSVDRRKRSAAASKKKKTQKSRGFAAKMATELGEDGAGTTSGPFQLPEGTEVALFVAPGPKELVVIKRICHEVGMGTLVVLLNARLSSIRNFGSAAAAKLFKEDFESVFVLSAAPQEDAPGCLLYRAYKQGDWLLARKPAVGPPKTILSQTNRRTGEECRAAFQGLELSDMEENVENAMESVANWFR
jgi:hypothetical protein